jgi:glycine cleavage system regulatory protein
MKKLKYISLVVLAFCRLNDVSAQGKSFTLKNDRYEIVVAAKSIRISVLNESNSVRTLTPTLQVLQAMQDPRMVLKRSDNNLSPQVAWKNPQDQKKSSADTTGELDFYKIAKLFTLQAASVSQVNATTVRFSFKKNASFNVQLDVSLPAGNETPVIETNLQVEKKAWYSVGFTGLASKDTASLQFLYQPMIWTWRRFPEKSYMTPEQFATTAATFMNDGNLTEGVAPDPSEIPYRFAKLNNSRYGFVLRNANAKAQPMLFAPILGGENSLMEPGQSFSFKTRYIIQSGDWYAGLNHILKNIFHYKTERQNASVSLNQTLDNIINMAMNDRYGGWIDSLKGFDYVQDAIGTVKVVSALHQLGVAMVTGNEEIYSRRALPTMEYVMSREKYLYTIDEAQKIQSPSHFLKGPCVEIGELSGLYQMTNGQTPAFLSELKRLFGKPRKLNLNTETGGGSWQDYLYLYRVSKNPADLEKAKQGADAYLESWKPLPSIFTNDPGLRDKASAF